MPSPLAEHHEHDRPFIEALFVVALTGVAYFVSAQINQRLFDPGGSVRLWIPSGLMLGLFLSSSRRQWPALLTGTLIGSAISIYYSGYPLSFVVMAALANGVETLGVAWFVARSLWSPVRIRSSREVAILLVRGAIVANAVTAWVGAAAVHYVFHRSWGAAWLIWWGSDGLGMLVVTPLILIWSDSTARWRSPLDLRVAEGAAMVVATGVVTSLVMGSQHGTFGSYVIFPLLFWSAFRLGMPGAAWVCVTTAAVTVWHTVQGVGPFAQAGISASEQAMRLHAFLGITVVSTLVLAAVVTERATERRRTRESEERYRSVMGAAMDAIVTIGPNSKIEFANAAVERVFGYKPSDVFGLDVTTLMPPEVRERYSAGVTKYLIRRQKNDPWRAIQLPGLHRDGRTIPLEVSFGAVADGGDSFTGIIRDVTDKHAAREALQRAEERMRFALAAAQVGVWEVNLRTGDAYWSETCEVMHGLAPGTFGRSSGAFMAVVHEADREELKAAIGRAMQSKTDAVFEYRVSLPNGSVTHMRSIGRFVADDRGVPVRGAGIVVDQSGQHALEEQVRQSQKMEVLGQLAGGVAHDFNNLLTTIHGYTTLLLDQTPANDKQRRDLEEILMAAERAESLTQQLLAFSRRQILAPRFLDLAHLVQEMKPMLERLLGESIRIYVDAPEGVAFARADSGQIEQVLLNLAVNARDAMPKGGCLELRVAGDDAQSVTLAVRDTGTGMSPEVLKRIFEPFYTTKPAGKGTGLGLATVDGIVKQSGGRITVDTALGRGSTFTVYLPSADRPTATNGHRPKVAAPRSETVLILEDDPMVRRLTERVLRDSGCKVMTAALPSEAFAIAERPDVSLDLLLTDIVLPEMSGRDAAERILELRPGLKVLYMSGYTDDEVVRYGVHQRGIHFLQKPFDPPALLARVEEVVAAAGPSGPLATPAHSTASVA